MLVAAVCKEAAWLHAAAGDGARARHLEERSRATVAALLRALWLPQRRRLLDCTEPGDGRRTFSQIPHALGAVLRACSPASSAPRRWRRCCDPEAVRSELGYQYFVLASLARAGRGERALAVLRELWGGMVAADTPTLWEVVDGRSSMSGCGSLCHAYACAALPILQGTVLGVSPLAPGFAQFRFAPQSLGVRWAEGRVPTPHGPVEVAWSQRDSDAPLAATIVVPDGTTALCGDGRRLAPGSHSLQIASEGEA